MSKKKPQEPSKDSLENDRSVQLDNVSSYLHRLDIKASKFNKNQIVIQDAYELIELSDKCSKAIKKYINPRKFMNKDQLLKKINDGLSHKYIEFDNEIDWLSRFGNFCVESCNRFIDSEVEIKLKSMQELHEYVIIFREEFGLLYNRSSTNFQLVKDNFEEYLNEVIKIADGTVLVCEDGLKYYNSSLPFSSRSIWLGSRIFLHGASNLLKKGGSERMLNKLRLS